MNGPTLTMGPVVDSRQSTSTASSSTTSSSASASLFHRSLSSPELVALAPSPKLSSAALAKSASTPTLPHTNGSSFEVPLFDVSFDAHPDFHTNLFLDSGVKKETTGRPATSGLEEHAGPAAVLRKGSLSERRLSSDIVPRTKSLTAAAIRKLSHDGGSGSPDGGLGSKLRPRKNSPVDRPISWMNKTSVEIRESEDANTALEVRVEDVGAADELDARPRALSGSLSNLRKNWKFSSRSPSPQRSKESKQGPHAAGEDGHHPHSNSSSSSSHGTVNSPGATSNRLANGTSPKSTKTPRKHPPSTENHNHNHLAEHNRRPEQTRGPTKALGRAGIYLTKIKQMSAARNTNADSDTSCASSATSLAPPASSLGRDKQQSHTTTSIAESITTTATTATDEVSAEMPPRKRDALWSVFQDLNNEYAYFAFKPVPQRMAIVKNVLLGFLRTYETHASNKQLHPDDLDRRANVLNDWWIVMLEMLEPGAGKPGLDRPLLLEATTKVMMRPEWRQASRNWLPLEDRDPDDEYDDASRTRPNTLSSQSSEPAISPTASINPARRNVGVMFTRNLIRQMHMVTTKMSLRHMPLSLAFFCGKACAYAFFFVPGAAEVMVRLWGLRPDVLRTAAQELGLPARPGDKIDPPPEAETLTDAFPSFLSVLTWSESRGGSKFKAPAQISTQVSQIQWNGPWVSRWKGRDTDLLFIFFKYFHILFAEFVPAGLPLSAQAHAPAFPFVHAQLLETIDATIHRQASLAMEQRVSPLVNLNPGNEPAGGPPLPNGVDNPNSNGPPLPDAQHGSDTTISALQFPSNNLRRGMSENRLIVMFRDVFSSRMDKSTAARHTFAEASMAMLKAATKRTSRFDQHACFTLCDFLEEVLLAYNNGFDTNDEWAGGAEGVDSETASVVVVAQVDKPGLQYIDWRFWLDTLNKMLEGFNTMTEIRVLSFIFAVWDILVADPVRKEEVCIGWLLEERMFDKFFNHWCPMVRSYWMRLLCWRICRDMGGVPDKVDGKIFVAVATRLTTTWNHYIHLKQSAEMAARLPPNTTPAEPQPGKKFAIIRTPVNTPPNVMLGFDSYTPGPMATSSSASLHQSPSAGESRPSNAPPPAVDNTTFAGMAVPLEDSPPPPEPKKRMSFFSRVLSLASGAGAGNAGGVAGAGPTSRRTLSDEHEGGKSGSISRLMGAKHGGGKGSPPSSSDGESLASSPTTETSYVFRFILTWYPPQEGQPMARVLARPRLPGPAHARLAARSRAQSPAPSTSPSLTAPSMPSFPPPTRTFSGSSSGGLIDEARNASPLSTEEAASTPPSLPQTFVLPPIDTDISLGCESPERSPTDERAPPPAPAPVEKPPNRGRELNPSIPAPLLPIPRPIKPEGFYRERAVYIGRALAEWGLVVHECNTFVDRRRHEGIPSLDQVEIPTLGVNEFRRPC